jgi:hypothetical protein
MVIALVETKSLVIRKSEISSQSKHTRDLGFFDEDGNYCLIYIRYQRVVLKNG